MSSTSEAGTDGKQSAGVPDVTVEQSLLPAPTENADGDDGDKRHHVAPNKPYNVFSNNEKWLITIFASCAAVFSPFTANIYFPAISVISTDFHKSVELINLTVTVYMVMQGLFTLGFNDLGPMFWGSLSDRCGRRPIMFVCLAILSLSCVGLALVPTSAYWLLMLLRCLQAMGSASTITLGAGIVGDIATPAERGGFFGVFGIGPLVGPCLGPIIGGALAQGLGWRSIFWFLCICSTVCGLGLFLFLPETLRAIVGDGSILAGWIYTQPISLIGRHRSAEISSERPARKPLKNPLLMFAYPEIFVILIFNGTLYAVMYGVTASLSISFEKVYPYLNEMEIGLCFIPMGLGSLVGSLFSGRAMDSYYRKIKDDAIRQSRVVSEKQVDLEAIEKDASFPIEKARLQILPWVVFVNATCIIGYGWALQSRVTIAVPLILQFIIGVSNVIIINATQTLLIDMMPNQGSSIMACNNIVRCLLGAGMVSIVRPVLNAFDDGWTYFFLGGLCVLVSPLLYVEIRWGPFWRQRRGIKHQ